MPDLDNSRLKVERAQEHLQALDRELATFYETNPCRMTAEEYPEHGRYVLRIQLKTAPKRLGLLVGDVVHCLRSALDQLAWQLARLTTDPPYDRTEFPILWDKTQKSKARFARVTKDIHSPAIPIIDELQPYQRGQAFRDDPLWKLHELWNIDKHRIIPATSTLVDFQIPAGIRPETQRLDDGDVVVVMPISVKDQMQFAPNPEAGVAFGGEGADVIITVRQLGELHDFIRDGVLPKFAGFFPEPPNP